MIERFGDAWARSVLRRPRATWLGIAALTLLAALLWPRFAIEPDVTKMLPRDVPFLAKARAVETQVAGSRTLLVLLEGDDLERTLPALAADLRESPYLAEVTATVAELVGERWQAMRAAPLWFVPPATLARLEEQLSDAGIAAELDRLESVLADPFAGRELATRDPLGLRWVLEDAAGASLPIRLQPGTRHLVLAGGTRALVRVVGRREPFDVEFARGLLADVERRVAAHGLRVTFLGGYAIARADAARIQRDLVWDSIGSALLVTLFLAVSMRSLLDPLLVFVPVALAVHWALPIGSFLWGPLAQLALSAAAVLIGLGVEIGIHWLHRYDAARRRVAREPAVRETTAELLRPALASALTTVAGFLALAAGSFAGLAGFGLLLSLGLMLALGANFTLLPLLTRHRRTRSRPSEDHWLARLVQRLHRGRGGRRAALALLLLAAAGALALGTFGLTFTTDPRSFRPADDPIVAAMAAAERELGMAPVPVIALLPPGYDVERLRAGLAQLEQQGAIRFGDGPQRWVPDPARAAAVARLHASASDLAERAVAGLTQRGYDPEPFRPGLATFAALLAAPLPAPPPGPGVVVDGVRHELAFLYVPRSFADRQGWLEFAGQVHAALGPDTELIASMAVMEEVRALLIDDLWRASGIALIAVLALTLLLAPNLRSAFVPLLPLALGMSITLGTIAVAGIPLQLGNFVVLPFLIGIGIDYGIHFAARLRTAPPEREQALAEGTVALWRNCVTTLLGFGSLVTAVTPGLASLGAISALGVLVCLAATLVTVPAVLPGSGRQLR